MLPIMSFKDVTSVQASLKVEGKKLVIVWCLPRYLIFVHLRWNASYKFLLFSS